MAKPTLCFYGTYESRFPRTITLKKAAETIHRGVIECHIPFWELSKDKQVLFAARHMIKLTARLAIIQIRLLLKYFRMPDHEALLVGYNGYFDMPLARLAARIRRKPLIYTPVFPLYETLVEDRGFVSRTSLKSRLVHRIDALACRLADLIILETQTYIDYYIHEFRVPSDKFVKIPLGADEKTFAPLDRPFEATETIRILFYGKFIPLQGIPYIVRAAKLLENDKDLEFIIIGSGQQSDEVHELAGSLRVTNIKFIDWIDYDELPGIIHDSDICLGIFGDTPKAQRGIPIKVYEALAMKKPVITGNTPAAREVFEDGESAVLCSMADPASLSEAILRLKNDRGLRDRIAAGGHELYQALFSAGRIAEDFESALGKARSRFSTSRRRGRHAHPSNHSTKGDQ